MNIICSAVTGATMDLYLQLLNSKVFVTCSAAKKTFGK